MSKCATKHISLSWPNFTLSGTAKLNPVGGGLIGKKAWQISKRGNDFGWHSKIGVC